MKTASALFFVLALALTGCGKKAADDKPGDKQTEKPEDGSDLATAKPDVTMTAEAWHAEFKKDEKAAKAKYMGKVVQLTGKVWTLAQNIDAGITFVHLKVENDLFGVRGGTKDLNLWERVPEGAEVTIRGRLPDMGVMTGELFPIHVVSVDKNPSRTFTAAELAIEFKKDKEKLKAAWGDKWVYVEGEFVRTIKSQHGSEQIVLKGAGGVDIKCAFPMDANALASKLKPGQKVKVLGQLSIYEEPSLQMALFRGQ